MYVYVPLSPHAYCASPIAHCPLPIAKAAPVGPGPSAGPVGVSLRPLAVRGASGWDRAWDWGGTLCPRPEDTGRIGFLGFLGFT